MARYIGRHGSKRGEGRADQRGAAIDAEDRGELPIAVFDGLCAGVQAHRSQFFKDLSLPFLKKFDVPTLILHGDDDQTVPIGAAGLQSAKIVKGATLKVIPGAPHGMCTTLKDQINAELLAFGKSERAHAA